MNPSYFRIKLDMEDAIQRLCDWTEAKYKERIETDYSNAVHVSLDKNGQWKGSCLYVYENEGWTVFEDLSGGYSFIDAKDWMKFAGEHEFIFAAYNDAIIYSEMIAIVDGKVIKNFIECDDMPEENINEGDGIKDINNWMDVEDFMDDDAFFYSDEGVVLIY